jgi:hypothetical protein
MDRELSIVLSRESSNYRSMAQTHYGLTSEQMRGVHVHHNPSRSKGGRNIPEHLYVYSPSMHRFAAHGGEEWIEWAQKGSEKALEVNRETNTGVYGLTSEDRSNAGKIGGAVSTSKGYLDYNSSNSIKTFETCSKGGKIGGAVTRDSGKLREASRLGGAVQGPRNKGMAWYHRFDDQGNIIRKRSKIPLPPPWIAGKGKTISY